jgi:hypothetical protein
VTDLAEIRRENLNRAVAVQVDRARIRREMKDRKLMISQVVSRAHEPAMFRLQVGELLTWIPGVGHRRAEKILGQTYITWHRHLGTLTARERAELVSILHAEAPCAFERIAALPDLDPDPIAA